MIWLYHIKFLFHCLLHYIVRVLQFQTVGRSLSPTTFFKSQFQVSGMFSPTLSDKFRYLTIPLHRTLNFLNVSVRKSSVSACSWKSFMSSMTAWCLTHDQHTNINFQKYLPKVRNEAQNRFPSPLSGVSWHCVQESTSVPSSTSGILRPSVGHKLTAQNIRWLKYRIHLRNTLKWEW